MDKKREKQIYQWLLLQQAFSKKWLNLSSVLGVAHGILVIIQSALLAWIISHIVTKYSAIQPLLFPLLLMIPIILLKAFCQWGKTVCGFKAGRQIREKLREKSLKKISIQDKNQLDSHTSGQWVTLIQERIDQVQDFYAFYLPQLKLVATLPFIIGIVVFIFNWAVALIFLITAPLVPLFMIFVGNKAADANRKNFTLLSRLSNHFLDRLKGLNTLRLLNRNKSERDFVEKAANGFRVQTMRVLRLAFLSSAVLEFFSSVSIALTAVYLGMSYLGYLQFGTWGQPLTLFTGFFLLLLAPEFYQTLRDLGTYYHSRAQAIGASDTLMTFLEKNEKSQQLGTLTLQDTDNIAIICQSVTVISTTGKKLLDNLSFCIKPHEQVALAGVSGSGKTTLLYTLLGLLAYEGSIKINGVELRELDKFNYYQHIAWLSQNPTLIYGSPEDNIRLGLSSFNDNSIDAAIDQAYASEFIQHLPEGKSTLLGENSARLSVGQAQRIALARMLIRDASLVLLDEPTASLDAHSESLVDKSLSFYTKKRTTLIATHRQNQLAKCDRILLMEQGKIIGEGSAETLKKTSKSFAQMCKFWELMDEPDNDCPAISNTLECSP